MTVRRGVLTRFPVGDDISAAVDNRLEFVVLDLAAGPVDEVALRAASDLLHASGMQLLAVADSDTTADRARALGVDLVVGGGAGAGTLGRDQLAVIDDPRAAASADYVALDLAASRRAVLARWEPPEALLTVPLIVLPGQLADVSLWDAVADRLVPRTACRAQRIDLDDSVDAMAETVLAAAPERFALAGHSLGGIVALQVCRAAPDRVTRVALLNSSGRAASREQLTAWATLSERVSNGEFDAVVEDLADLNVMTDHPDAAENRRRWVKMAHEVGRDGLARQLRAQMARPDSLPTLGSLTLPALVVSGARDSVAPPPLQHELAAGLPNAVLVSLPTAGHMSPLENPVEVAEHLLEWLAA